MHQIQRSRTRELLEKRGVGKALFANPKSVTWLTGFAPSIQLGPHLFAGGPPLLWYEDGHFTLVVVDAYVDTTAEIKNEPDCSVVGYQGYTYERELAGAEHLGTALRKVLGSDHGRGQTGGVVGVEERDVPVLFADQLFERIGDGGKRLAIDGWLEPLRMVKTGEELKKLRENFALADIGQAATRKAVQAEKREIDIWAAAHGAIQRAAGRRVALGNDCVAGQREQNFTGWPLDYEISSQGSLIVDLGTGLHGYYSDGCGTYYPDEPTAEQAAAHEIVADALDLAISMIRPGVVAREIDNKVRSFIGDAGYPDYPHHTGHGIGVASHERPRIVPYSQEVLEEGMVVMLELGIYFPGEYGVRLEDGVLVTGEGCEVLTKHDKSLP